MSQVRGAAEHLWQLPASHLKIAIHYIVYGKVTPFTDQYEYKWEGSATTLCFVWISFKVGKRRLFVLVDGMGYAAVTCSMFTGVGRGGGVVMNLKIIIFGNEVEGSFSNRGWRQRLQIMGKDSHSVVMLIIHLSPWSRKQGVREAVQQGYLCFGNFQSLLNVRGAAEHI